MNEGSGIKGVDRCDAVSYQEILAKDPLPAASFMREERQVDFGLEPVHADRYTSKEFFDLEAKAMWFRTWQYVCRVEQIPNAGDTHVFDLINRSAIVVRQQDGSIKAFQNVCRHRGRKLVTHNSCQTRLRCPFHGFTWNTDGSFKENPTKWDFPQIDESQFGLIDVRCESWGGFVFVNFDPKAQPLASVAHPLPEHFKYWQIEDCYLAAHVAKVVPANWKAVTEAFIESFHVTLTHPQITPYTGDANTQYDILSDHVDRFITPLGTPSPLVDSDELDTAKLVDLWMRQGSKSGTPAAGDELQEGETAREFFARWSRNIWGRRTGRDYSKVPQTDLLDAISYNMFPNFSVWGGLTVHLGYRFRPWQGRVDQALMETFLFNPVGKKGRPAPAQMTFLTEEQGWKDAPELGYLGPVYDQDQSNLGPLQKGLEALGDGVIHFGRYSESRCRHLHHMIDRYISEYQAGQRK